MQLEPDLLKFSPFESRNCRRAVEAVEEAVEENLSIVFRRNEQISTLLRYLVSYSVEETVEQEILRQFSIEICKFRRSFDVSKCCRRLQTGKVNITLA